MTASSVDSRRSSPRSTRGQWVTIARRQGAEWFVGTITNGAGRSIPLSLSFLAPGLYEARMYSDAPDAAESPDHLVRETRTVSSSDTLTIQLAPGGGQVIRLKPIK